MSQDNSEPGEEECPICQRRNQPGAADTCSHYIGSAWDGDLIWGQFESEPSKQLFEAWAEVQAAWSAREEEGRARRKSRERLCQTAGVEPKWLDTEVGAAKVLEAMDHFVQGDQIDSDGMLSGSGYSLYHEDPEVVTKLTARLRRLAKHLE